MKDTHLSIKRNITVNDILETKEYELVREQKRTEIAQIKKNRRLQVGPHATFHFECYATIWYQIHEMVRIEKGGKEQVFEELDAYKSLVPKGNELIATLMFEIPNAEKRMEVLSRLGGVEETICIKIDGERIDAIPEGDVNRTKTDGKTSAVHFVRFILSGEQIRKFLHGDNTTIISIYHENYGHSTRIPPAIRDELSKDLVLENS